MPLNALQRNQIDAQVKAHATAWKYKIDVPVGSPDPVLRGLIMYPGVLQPMSSGQFGRFLHDHPEYYRGKRVLDMGCGSGALGIIMARQGASEVVYADIDPICCQNTQENVAHFRVKKSARIIQSDMYAKVKGRFGLMVFAHPYFGDSPVPGVPVTRGMLDPGRLVPAFLRDAHRFTDGPVLMPYFHLAGKTNDPAVHGRRLGLTVRVLDEQSLTFGLQHGRYTVYELTR